MERIDGHAEARRLTEANDAHHVEILRSRIAPKEWEDERTVSCSRYVAIYERESEPLGGASYEANVYLPEEMPDKNGCLIRSCC